MYLLKHSADVLDNYTGAKLGRLISASITTSEGRVEDCARDCLDLPPSKCLSFNYDFGVKGTCELLEEIEGHEVEIHEVFLFGLV